MALIERFEQRGTGSERRHGGVTCGYHWFDVQGKRILQFDTYGSDERQIPGKISQSIQLDEEGARELSRDRRPRFGVV
jgi:hypothetical protein